MMSLGDRLDRLAQWGAVQLGRARGFGVASGLVGIWLVSGFVAGWSGSWALLAGTGTSLVALSMVYLLMHALNRDNEALQEKLDALRRAHELAQDRLRRFDGLTEADLADLRRAAARPARPDRPYDEESD